MGKDEADDHVNLERRRACDRFLEQRPRNTAAPELFIHINADLGRAAISAARQKGFQRQPAGELPIDFQNPKRMSIRRMLFQPTPPVFQRDRFQLGGRDSSRDGGVVNLNDGRQIGFDRVADF